MSADKLLLTIEYVPVDEAVLWDRNPKRHDIRAPVKSIWTYGFQDRSKHDAALEAIVYGNGRIQATLRAMPAPVMHAIAVMAFPRP